MIERSALAALNHFWAAAVAAERLRPLRANPWISLPAFSRPAPEDHWQRPSRAGAGRNRARARREAQPGHPAAPLARDETRESTLKSKARRIWRARSTIFSATSSGISRKSLQGVRRRRCPPPRLRGKAVAAWQRDAALRLAEASPNTGPRTALLARPADVGSFCRNVDTLRDDVARLEKRIEQLSDPARSAEGAALFGRDGNSGKLALRPAASPALFRLAKILWITLRFGLDEFALASGSRLARVLNALLFFRSLSEPRGARLRLALEALGPSSSSSARCSRHRRDLCPPTSRRAGELQDRVPPFPASSRSLRSSAPSASRSRKSSRNSSCNLSRARRSPKCISPCSRGTEAAVKILRPG